MSAPVSVGDVVARKYRVDRVLGEGGMGVVVAATDTQLDRRVAIKFLLPQALTNPDIVARFAREARAAAKIHSEHVVRVIEVGELDAGVPYMVMEYLEGRDLAERIRSGPTLTAADAAGYVLQACEALAEAHAAGIVHRDLKPANLFLAQQPDRTVSVKVLDFGISKAPVGAGGITSTQAVMGSPHYMSPEQLVSAKHVDHRSDVWSLGVVLYEALAGSPPFTGDTMPEIVAQILQSPLPSLRAQRPDVPVELERVIGRCTAKDPGARFANVAQLARALAAFAPDGSRSADRALRILGVTGAVDGDGAAPSDAHAGSAAVNEGVPLETRAEAAWGNTRAAGVPTRSRLPYAIAAVLSAAALCIAFAVFGGRARPPDPPKGPAATRVDLPPPPPSVPEPVSLPPAPTAAAAESTSASGDVASSKPPVRKAVAMPAKPVASKTIASAPPPSPAAPPPIATPSDPLHMGIK